MSLKHRIDRLEAGSHMLARCRRCAGYRIDAVAHLEPFTRLAEGLGYWPATCGCADASPLTRIAVEYGRHIRNIRPDGLVDLDPPTRLVARAYGWDEDEAVEQATAICREHGWLREVP